MGTLGPCTYGGLVHEGYVHNPNCTPKVTNPIWIHLGVAHQHMENSPCADNFAENPWISIAMLCSVALLEGLKKVCRNHSDSKHAPTWDMVHPCTSDKVLQPGIL